MPSKEVEIKPTLVVAPVDWRTLRLWQIQPIRDALIVVAVIGLLYLGKVLSTVTVPMLLALLLAYLFEPLIGRVTSRGIISRQGAAIGIIGGIGLVVVVPLSIGLTFAVLQGLSAAERLTSNVQALSASLENPEKPELRAALPSAAWREMRDTIIEVRNQAHPTIPPTPPVPTPPPTPGTAAAPIITHTSEPHSDLAITVYRFAERGVEWVRKNSQEIGKRALATGAGAVELAAAVGVSLFEFFFGLFLTGFFFFFFSTSFGRVLKFWKDMIPERRKTRTIELLLMMDRVVSGFVRGRLIICGLFMLYLSLGYWAAGVPAPIILGVSVGALSIVPYASSIGIPVAMILLWLDPSGPDWQAQWWWIVGGPILVHIILQIVDDYVLSPAIQGKATGMDTPTIVFASITGGLLAGFYGLLIAIPVAACVRILMREIVVPRIKAWAAGKERDPLPISTKG